MYWLEGYCLLVGAMINQAIDDARKGDKEAEEWLMTTGIGWADIFDIQITPEYVNSRIK